MTQTTISVFTKMPARDQSTVGAYRSRWSSGLFSGMLSDRLDEIAQQAERAVSRGADQPRHFRADRRVDVAQRARRAGRRRARARRRCSPKSTAWRDSVSPRPSSIGRSADCSGSSSSATVEKDKSPSGPLADEFIRNFLQDEPIPGIVYEYALNQRFLPEITLAEVNALAKDWAPDRNRVVGDHRAGKDKATRA